MRGCIERITNDRVSGWAICDTTGDQRATINVYIEDLLVGTTIAHNYREDLKLNNLGDGKYGFIVSLSGSENVGAAYLDGRIRVEAKAEAHETILIPPADFLIRSLQEAVLASELGRLSFDSFIKLMMDLTGAKETASIMQFHVINAARAHFPEWRKSSDFLHLASKIADQWNKPLSSAFYRCELNKVEAAETSFELDDLQAAPVRTYGTFSDLASPMPNIKISFVSPTFLGGGNPVSFMEESGLFAVDKQSSGFGVPLLAFREYAFGEPHWWYVFRESRQIPVARQIYYMDFEVLLSVLSSGGIVCFDMSNEGPAFEPAWSEVVVRSLRDLRIPQKQLLYVTQNLAYSSTAGIVDFPGIVGHAHYFISIGLAALAKEFPTPLSMVEHINRVTQARAHLSEENLRYFLCLNFTPRWHRWMTVLFLLHRGYLDRGFVSFPGERNFKMAEMTDLTQLLPAIRHRDDLLASVPDLLKITPLVLDVNPDTRATPNYEFPNAYMTSSLFQIVTESEVDGVGRRRVTEKILKPIIGLQPFIVMGNAGSLDILRSMGFKTFAPVIDEQYDSLEDPGARIDAVFNEIDRLMTVPLPELRERLATLTEIVAHNFVHLLTVAPLFFVHPLRHVCGDKSRVWLIKCDKLGFSESVCHFCAPSVLTA